MPRLISLCATMVYSLWELLIATLLCFTIAILLLYSFQQSELVHPSPTLLKRDEANLEFEMLIASSVGHRTNEAGGGPGPGREAAQCGIPAA